MFSYIYQGLSENLLKYLLFLIEWSWHSYWKSIDCTSLFVSKLLCSIDFFVLFMPVPHCINSFSIMKILRSGNCKLSSFVLLPQYCLALLNPLQFNINFRISLSISTQKACWNIEWDWIYYVSVWRDLFNFFTILSLPIREHPIFIYLWFFQVLSATFQCKSLHI